MKQRVNTYFEENNLSSFGNYKIILKSCIFILVGFLIYFSLLTFALPTPISLFLCVLLGCTFAGIGFNVMHDGAHGSYSKNAFINEVMGYSLNLLGGNLFIWKNRHNLNHHSFTNVDGIDDDINIDPWIRTHFNQKRRWFHRYQHIYSPLLYSITYLAWIWGSDFKMYFSGKIANTIRHKMNLKEHFIFWASKLIYIALFFVIPSLRWGFLPAFVGYLTMSAVCGLILGIVFQLAHIVEKAKFPLPSTETNQLENEWLLHQIATTANFAMDNRVLSWLFGGLNFQVVHHIYPKISHIHYPAINKLIRETCTKFNVQYNEYPTFWEAFRSHLAYLKYVGQNLEAHLTQSEESKLRASD